MGRDLPNIWTPFSMSLMMMALDSLKSDSTSSVQLKGVPGLIVLQGSAKSGLFKE